MKVGETLVISTDTYSDSLSEIKRLLERNNDTFERTARRTRTLRVSNPNVKVPTSIYTKEPDEANEKIPLTLSVPSSEPSEYQPSGLDFEFDDEVVNSQAYRRILAKAEAKQQVVQQHRDVGHEKGQEYIQSIEKHLFAEKQLTATLEEALVDLEMSSNRARSEMNLLRKKCASLENELASLRVEGGRGTFRPGQGRSLRPL